MCGPRDKDCVDSLTINTGRCLVPCSGLYADVKDSTQLNLVIDKQPEFDLLVAEYENYKHFNEMQIERSYFKGTTSWSYLPMTRSYHLDQTFFHGKIQDIHD